MRKYASQDSGRNQVGLNLGAFLDTPLTQPLVRRLKPNAPDLSVRYDVRQGLHSLVEEHAPAFTGERGTTFTIQEVRGLNLNDKELTKHCLDFLLTHFTDAKTLINQIETLDYWNEYGKKRIKINVMRCWVNI